MKQYLSVLSAREYAVQYDLDPLERHGRRLMGNLHRALDMLGVVPRWPVDDGSGVNKAMTALFGWPPELGQLYTQSPISWGFRFQEPQFTRGWEYFLSPAQFEDTAYERCRAFVAALFRGASRKPDGCLALECASHSLAVVAEQRIDEAQRRLDLLISWLGSDDHQRTVVIEAKLGHKVTPGQLRAYGDYVDGLSLAAHSALFLVVDDVKTSDRDAASKGDWSLVRWRPLLRRYEQELMRLGGHVDDPDFARFRRTLWERCKGI